MKKQYKLIIISAVFLVVIFSGCGVKGGPGTGMFEKNSDKITIRYFALKTLHCAEQNIESSTIFARAECNKFFAKYIAQVMEQNLILQIRM